MEGEKGTVCVTGGTGFIGSWLIMRLLDHGYSVRTTVRSNPEHRKDLTFLTSLPGASERLKIFDADLRDPQSFGAAIEGCVGVFHVATPVDFEDKEPEEVVTKRSIDGALSILNTCLISKTVKRLVYTSSASAVVVNNSESLDGSDESCWSDVDYIRASKLPTGSYMISKTLTERAVLEFSENNGFDVVTLIPSFVVGPFICPKFPSSIQVTLSIVSGKHDPRFGSFSSLDVAHVDDVARAHIFIFEHHEAKGRYNCSLKSTSVKSVSKWLSAKYPELQIQIIDSQKETEGDHNSSSLSSKKLKDLGFEFKFGVEEMFDDAIKCCNEKGYL